MGGGQRHMALPMDLVPSVLFTPIYRIHYSGQDLLCSFRRRIIVNPIDEVNNKN